MKKWILLFCMALLLSGCRTGREEGDLASMEETMPFATESVVSEPTEATAPEFLSQEIAMLEGYVVIQDGDVRHNAGSRFAFLDACQAGSSGSVILVQFADPGYVRYDLRYDGSDYILTFEKDGRTVTERSQVLVMESGLWKETQEPYDRYDAYLLNDIILYRDLIAEPDFEGVKEIFLHAKEGEPPVKSYATVDETDPILQLLMTAEYMPIPPEGYCYGMKLLMSNRDGKELVIELDLNEGYYRYGMQTYCYGETEEMLTALGLESWPEAVMEEFREFLK